MGMSHLHQIRIASGLNILAALWLIISPYGFGYHLLNPPFWNSIVVGVAVAFFAILRIVMPFRYPEISWINFLLGVWLLVAPFLLGFADLPAALWNTLFVGVFAMLMAVWSVGAGRRGEALIE